MSGFRATWIYNTGAPGTTKCPVAPASVIASSTAILIADVLNMVSALSEDCRFKLLMIVVHAFALVGKGGAGGRWLVFLAGLLSNDVSLSVWPWCLYHWHCCC